MIFKVKVLPLVSVIIPNYNHERYLQKRIESVLNQKYTNIEVLLLDDFSTDNSRDILNEYCKHDHRIKLHFNNSNSGSVFKQWRKGITLSSGKYIWIAESDDYADDNFLDLLVCLLEDNEKLSFVYSNSFIINEHSDITGKTSDWKNTYFATDRWNKDFYAEGVHELNQYLSLQCTVNNASATVFRRSSIINVGGIDTSFRYTGDWLTYIKLCCQGQIAYVAACLNYYREHEANASKQSIANGSQLFERQKCYAFLFQSGYLTHERSLIMMYQACQEYIDLIYIVAKKNKQILIYLRMIKEIAFISPRYLFYIQHNFFKFFLSKRLRNIILLKKR